MNHKQCLLERKEGSNTIWQISYIPEKYAIKGSVLKLFDHDKWTDGWIVAEVYNSRDSKEVSAHERDYLKQRKASDI